MEVLVIGAVIVGLILFATRSKRKQKGTGTLGGSVKGDETRNIP